MWGKAHSLETRKLMSQRQQKPVVQLSLDGKLLNVYNSITVAAKTNKVSRQLIGHCCNGTRKTGKGFCWRFQNETKK